MHRASSVDRSPPVARREPRLMAGVAAIEMRSGHTLGMLEFTAGVMEVYDVKALPGVRRAGMRANRSVAHAVHRITMPA